MLDLPDRIEPLRLDKINDDNALVIDGVVEELTGDYGAIRVTVNITPDSLTIVEARTIDAHRYAGFLKRIVSHIVKQAQAAGYNTLKFQGMLSTTEVEARGANVTAPGEVTVALNPPDTFATWLLDLADGFVTT